jgi:hypothetical protein
MARLGGIIKFIGKLAGLISYRIGKVYYLRTAPKKKGKRYRVHPNTKRGNDDFGEASRVAKRIRTAFKQEFELIHSGGLHSHMSGLLIALAKLDPAPAGSRNTDVGLETAEGQRMFRDFRFQADKRLHPKLRSACIRDGKIYVIAEPHARRPYHLTEGVIDLRNGDYLRQDHRHLDFRTAEIILEHPLPAVQGHTHFLMISGERFVQGVVVVEDPG